MDPQTEAMLRQLLRSMQADRSQTAINLSNAIGQFLDNPSAGLPGGALAMLQGYAQQKGMTLPPGLMAAVAQPSAGGDNPPDPTQGPQLTSGVQGQPNMTLAQRAAEAARTAAQQQAQRIAAGRNNAGTVSIDETNPTGTTVGTSPTAGGQRPPTTNVGAPPPGGGSGQTLPGGFNAAQGTALGGDDEMLRNFALRAAGFDPNRLTRFSKIAGRALIPLVQARRAAHGLMGGSANLGHLPQDIASFAKEFTTGGADFFGNAQRYGQQVQGSEQFKNAMGGLGDQQQVQAAYRGLLPLLFAGVNPMVAQAAADTFDRTSENFDYLDAGFTLPGQQISSAPGAGVFNDWLSQNEQSMDPLMRRIFGRR